MFVSVSQSPTIYISQKNGNDRDYSGTSPVYTGTGNGPFQTLEKAWRTICELRAVGDSRTFTVAFVDDYRISSPITLQNGNLSPNVAPSLHPIRDIIFTACNGARIIGGFFLTDWKKDTFNGRDCYAATLPEEYRDADFHDLYVNGHYASPTRYPAGNASFEAESVDSEDGHMFRFTAKKADIAGLADLENADVGYPMIWTDAHTPISAVDREHHTITMKYPSWKAVDTDYTTPSYNCFRYHFERLAEGFTEQGMWYYKKSEHKVYYLPKDNEDMASAEVIVPVSDGFFHITGDADRKICGIHLENLTLIGAKGDHLPAYFRCGTGLSNRLPTADDAPDSIIRYSADCQSVTSASGAVIFRYAEGCSVENCSLSCAGVYGIGMERGCRGITVTGNDIHDISAGGIHVIGGKTDEPSANQTSGNIISENRLHDLGRRYTAGCGILLQETGENIISRNEICRLEYSGISCGWYWGYHATNNYRNRICENHIHHIGTGALADIGGIYLLGDQYGTVVENNRIHDIAHAEQFYGGWGIYTDEGSQNILIRHNVVYNVTSEPYHQNYGAGNVVTENIFAFGRLAAVRLSLIQGHTGITFERNVFLSNGAPFIFGDITPLALTTAKFIDNIFYDMGGAESAVPAAEGALPVTKALELYGHVGNRFVNPDLINPASFDFTPAKDGSTEKLFRFHTEKMPFAEQ